MKKSILFSVFAFCATVLQAQTIATGTISQDCAKNGNTVDLRAVSGSHNGHEYVDLGLSVKWATCNVGATTPEGYGNYFAWGETTTKENYSWSTYFDSDEEGKIFTKYYNYGGKTVLDPEDDAAYVNWGGNWRMPTKAEWQELKDNCTWEWTTQNGIDGYKVTSNKAGYTYKFIFLPAAGYRYDSNLSSEGSEGDYWSSSLVEDGAASDGIGAVTKGLRAAYSLCIYRTNIFLSSGTFATENGSPVKEDGYVYLKNRYKGQSVRSVLP